MTRTTEEHLQRLLRGEIAAAETYTQAIDDGTNRTRELLRELQHEHGRAIKVLCGHLNRLRVAPDTSSGAWGHFARAVEGGAKLLGDRAALRALREGERRGLDDYEQALATATLPLDCRRVISEDLAPAQRRHIARLDAALRSR